MDDSEKDAWKERVGHASGDQAKKALQHLIDRCTKSQNTIAWAIKDAIAIYTPLPDVIHETQDSKDDKEAIIASSRRKSAKKEESESSSSEDEDIPASNSKHRRSSRRRDKKTKNKLQEKSKERSGHDVGRRDSSKNKSKKKHKHARKHQIEGRQNTPDGSMERSSKKSNPTVIDLVTSSDVESPEKQQPSHPNPDKPATDDDLDIVTSSEDEPSHPAGPKNGDGGRRARSVTVSVAKASSHHENTKAGSPGLGGLDKKRKAPDLTVEDAHTEQPVEPTPVIHPTKKPRQDVPEEIQESQRGLRCDKCKKKFSIHELVRHRWICKGKAAQNDDHHHISKVPANDQPHQPKPVQEDRGPAGDFVTADPQDIMQPPSKPVQTAPAGRELSIPPSFVQGPNRLTRGPTPTPIVLARLKAGTQSLPSDCPPPPKPDSFPIVSLGNVLQPPRRDPPMQRLLPDPLGVQEGRRCIFCPKWFKEWENHGSVCKCHTGEYRRLTDVNKDQYRLNFGIDPVPPFLAWSCCLRQGKYATPCRIGRHVAAS